MLANLILGIAAGAAAPHAEPYVKQAVEGVASDRPVSPRELGLLSFALCLFGAAILGALFEDDGAVALTLGGILGVFAPRVIAQIRRRRYPDYDDGQDQE